MRAGQKIILTGWIGLDGMQIVMDKKERELRERFSRAFLAEIKDRQTAFRPVRQKRWKR